MLPRMYQIRTTHKYSKMDKKMENKKEKKNSGAFVRIIVVVDAIGEWSVIKEISEI